MLLTLEAVKMETVIFSPSDARIAEVAVKAGQTIEAKDLLVVLD
jgi:pyruvate carboxylase